MSRSNVHGLRRALQIILLAGCSLASAQSAGDLSALDLESADDIQAVAAAPSHLTIELALGNDRRRFDLATQDTARASIDWVYRQKLGAGTRLVVSDRIDFLRPHDARGGEHLVNSLREAYVGWTDEEGNLALDFGRVNIRSGPAYGYNPTDFFRGGSLRSMPTADPVALRANRMGTVVLRAQSLWRNGSLTVNLSPELRDGPSTDPWSLDLGSTNAADRALVTLATQWSDRLNTQLHVFKQAGSPVQLGASGSVLVSDAVVAYAELTSSREPAPPVAAMLGNGSRRRGERVSAGLTYTTPGKLSITAELQYNAHALADAQWDRAALVAPRGLAAYVADALWRQDLAGRRGYLIYVSQRDLVIKNLHLTAFVQTNAHDRSRLSWLELRRQWTALEAAVQLQYQSAGRGGASEFGLAPNRASLAVLAGYRF
ncbi:MAG TPA: hypothetical protein PKJ45_02250 [Rubrivivax sp.]|nr:hypothetical protein [Burkholderiales bacterium]HNU10167.1 hypothetical protein [Rubrivivax sp.]